MIASRKSALPELPDPYLERPGLVRRLTEGLGAGKRATLVQAGPGMGKTALLGGYLRQVREDGAALALWCDLTRADRDAAVFCRRVHATLRRDLPELSAQAVEVTATLGHAGLAQAMGLLCDDLEAALAGRALVLVLDDAQHLPDDADFLLGLEALIRYFPEDGQLVLAGRSLPPVKLAQFQLRGQLLKIEDADLRFRPGEIVDLAQLFGGGAVGGAGGDTGGDAGGGASLTELASKAQGWPAGIAHALATGGQASGPDLLHAYLREEVVDSLPADVREGLGALAFLEAGDEAAVRAALGPKGADRLGAEPALRPFITRDGEGIALQPLLREAVQQAVLESWPEADRAALFRGLANCVGDPAEAIGLLHRAGAWQGAESRLLEALPGLLAASRTGTVRDLLAGFPEDARRSAGLQYVAGELARREGRLDVAVRHLGEAERLAAEPGGPGGPEGATAAGAKLGGAIQAALAAAYGAMGDTARQRACAERGIAVLEEADHPAIGACYNALGMYHVYMQDLGEARAAFDQAMRHYREAGDVAGQMRVQHNMGLAWSRGGDFARAISHYREAIRVAQAHHQLPLALTYNNLALCEIYMGRLEEAGKALEQGMALAERLMSVRDRSVLLRTMARLQMESGSHEDARAFFESSLDEAVAAGDRMAQMYGYLGMAELHLKEGRHREADAAVDHGLEATAIAAGDPRTAEALVLRAMAAVQAGRPADAERFLAESEQANSGAASPYSRFQVERLRAEAAALEGNPAQAATHAQEARALSQQFGYPLGPIVGVPDGAPEATPSVEGDPSGAVETAGVGRDAGKPAGTPGGTAAGTPGGMPGGTQAGRPAGTPPSTPLAAVRPGTGPLAGTGPLGGAWGAGEAGTLGGSAPLTRTGFLGGPSAAVSPPVLDVAALGAFKVQVEGKPVAPGAWKIAKARIAMAYLLLHPAGATKDALLELLYPGEDPARTAVNMVLSRLRGALEPDAPKGAPSRFVLFQDGRYMLNQGVRMRFDAVDFRRLVKLAREPGIDGARRRAILDSAVGLYQGPFMEGFEESAWIDIERENLRRMMKEACNDLMGLAAAEDDWKGLELAADALLEREPESQDGYRGRILALALQERREDAVRACQVAEDLLTGAMRMELEPETAELLDMVREDDLTIRAARSLMPAVS